MHKMIFAGFGGQGVLSLGQFFAYSAMIEKKEVSWLPSYGPEMRGGTANCAVVISDKPVASPLVTSPNVLVAMNKPSLDKFVNAVEKGGTIFVNSSLISEKVKRTDVTVHYVDTASALDKIKNTKVLNVIMLGAVNGKLHILKDESMMKGIEGMLKAKPKLIDLNKQAYAIGEKF